MILSIERSIVAHRSFIQFLQRSLLTAKYCTAGGPTVHFLPDKLATMMRFMRGAVVRKEDANPPDLNDHTPLTLAGEGEGAKKVPKNPAPRQDPPSSSSDGDAVPPPAINIGTPSQSADAPTVQKFAVR
jgi:hypothetical protein